MIYQATLDARREGSIGAYSHVVVAFDAAPDESLTQAAIREARVNGFETLVVKNITAIAPDVSTHS